MNHKEYRDFKIHGHWQGIGYREGYKAGVRHLGSAVIFVIVILSAGFAIVTY